VSLLRTDRSWREEVRHRVPVRYLPQTTPDHLRGTWRDAKPATIDASLRAALRRPTHGWLVAGASADVPVGRTLLRAVAGREVVLWRDADGTLLAGPGACPHLGARLDACDVVDGTVLCRWHGMQLGPASQAEWRTYAAHDDGVLAWVRLGTVEDGVEPTDRPVLARRPALEESLASVISLAATCEPRDIIANRLDPWHGAWLHPYAFSDLAVDEAESTEDRLVLDVAYRLGRTFAVPVRAEFTCPDSHTIVMTITDGEGTGSVVETHATPLTAAGIHPARTVMTEAVVATSDRFGFRVARSMAPLVRVGMRASATQLWADDLVYAARLYELRRSAADR
jgi:phenylpropionate dioxygenase-like ring-hydroxylating dioxygenase large terminal subunit